MNLERRTSSLKHWFPRAALAVVALTGLWSCSSASSGGGAVSTGTKLCAGDSDCGGMDCEHISTADQGTCVSHCDTDPTACPHGTACVVDDTVGLQASCLVSCATASCPANFDCTTSFGGASMVCIPNSW